MNARDDSLQQGKDELLRPEMPRFVQMEPVGQCNLRCRMCPIQFRTDGAKGTPPAFMSYEVFCSLVDQFTGLEELHLQGLGEPLMHPRFFDMVAYATARGIRVSTNSNLTLLSDRRALECVRSGLARIHVSLDGATAQTYQHIRVRARFDKVLRNVGRLVAARNELKATLPEIQLVAVAMRSNLQELPELVRLARELGIDVLSVQHLCHDFGEPSLPAKYRPMREFVDAETLLGEDPARVDESFAKAREAAIACGVSLRLPNVKPKPHAASLDGRSRCDWPWRGACVSYNGEAMPCCMVATPDRARFGNMQQEGVAAVWTNAEYQAFRERLASGDPPDVCRSCAIYSGTF